MKMIHSAALGFMVTKANEFDFDMATVGVESSCTLGYNTDGSTVFEIFENGVELASKIYERIVRGEVDLQIFYGVDEEHDHCAFFIGRTEAEAGEELRQALLAAGVGQ